MSIQVGLGVTQAPLHKSQESIVLKQNIVHFVQNFEVKPPKFQSVSTFLQDDPVLAAAL